jgi:hypothetical protein
MCEMELTEKTSASTDSKAERVRSCFTVKAKLKAWIWAQTCVPQELGLMDWIPYLVYATLCQHESTMLSGITDAHEALLAYP